MVPYVRELKTAKQQRGLSLIELLIAVLVVLLGMMGYVTSVNYSLKSARQSLFSTQASAHAYNVMELGRLFPTEFIGVPFDPVTGVTGTLIDCAAAAADCDANAMLTYQLYLISCSINPANYAKVLPCERTIAGGNTEQVIDLPNGQLMITDTSSAEVIGGVNYTRVEYTVTVSWDDVIGEWDVATKSWVAPTGAGATRQQFVLRSDDLVVVP